jgi:1-acyl-sn-glycerol-3-phosphate acyltransferase
VPIVPVVIEGTRDILPKQSMLIRPQAVVVRLLPAIDARPFGRNDRALRDQVHAVMGSALAELRADFSAAVAAEAVAAPSVLASSPAHASSRAHPAKAGDPRSA